jgi:hypothetical protein
MDGLLFDTETLYQGAILMAATEGTTYPRAFLAVGEEGHRVHAHPFANFSRGGWHAHLR